MRPRVLKAPIKRSSLIVYEADIFNCFRQPRKWNAWLSLSGSSRRPVQLRCGWLSRPLSQECSLARADRIDWYWELSSQRQSSGTFAIVCS